MDNCTTVVLTFSWLDGQSSTFWLVAHSAPMERKYVRPSRSEKASHDL